MLTMGGGRERAPVDCACFPEQGCTCLFCGRRSEGHRDVPVKVCQKSGNERVCTALGRRFVFDDF